MARPVTTLVIFFIAFNLFAGMLMATGVAGVINIDATVGGDDEREQRTSNNEVESGNGTGSTLFAMYNVLTTQLSNFFGMIFPGLAMLRRAGVPAFIVGGNNTVGFLPPLFSTLVFIDVMAFLRGWDL